MADRWATNVSILRSDNVMRYLNVLVFLLVLALFSIPSCRIDSRKNWNNKCREIMKGYNLAPAVDACLNYIIKRESER